ncbi:MAG: serine/threonine-protein kinase [Halofilum sp. (in: g-proteobacteria)]|nr:serine/threonine-protein kinase [Halofilum sp. (in: g-proteobacteria)]
MVARPGEAPQRLQPGTRLDVAALQPGTVLDGRYRFIERVGHGAFGTVMRFEDSTVGEEIILKFLNESVSEDERVAKRFVQELRYARRVTHPNVIRIYDFLRIGGLYAISMEYFAGFPLTREMLQDQPMRTDRALRLLREITFGMAAAHRSGVVHRDLKPANILMSHVDQVKIVDFGIAAAAFRDPEDTEITQTGDFVGTPAYTSPEQVRGQQVDARTDIYSLGVVMYRMLGGRLPYQDKERRNLLLRHLEGRPPALAELNPELPKGLPEVVAKTMAVKPDQRYQSMTELRTDLEEYVR